MNVFYNLSTLNSNAKKYKKAIDDIDKANAQIQEIAKRISERDWSGGSKTAFVDTTTLWSEGMENVLSNLNDTYNAIVRYGINGGGGIRKQFDGVDKS
jgi:uncharacterized protein YukE